VPLNRKRYFPGLRDALAAESPKIDTAWLRQGVGEYYECRVAIFKKRRADRFTPKSCLSWRTSGSRRPRRHLLKQECEGVGSIPGTRPLSVSK